MDPVPLLLTLAAAALPLLAIVETTKETFSGTLSGSRLVLVSDDGPTCTGRLVPEWTQVSLVCSDGRTGMVRYQLDEQLRLGTGYGSLDGEPFTLVLG